MTGCSSSFLNVDTDLLFFMKRFENILIWSFHCLKILFVGSIENFSRSYFGGGGGGGGEPCMVRILSLLKRHDFLLLNLNISFFFGGGTMS